MWLNWQAYLRRLSNGPRLSCPGWNSITTCRKNPQPVCQRIPSYPYFLDNTERVLKRIRSEFAQLDLNKITPLEALNKLEKLKEKLLDNG